MPANERALAFIRAALGEEVAEQVSSGQVVEYSPEDYALNELAKTIAGKLPEEVVRQVYNGKLQSPPMTLDTALSEYSAYKAGEGVRDKDAALRIKKLRKDLKSCLGEHKLEKGSLAAITRADANTFRDHLLERMKPNSVLRNVAVVKAAVNYVTTEHSLSIPNVFNRLRIKGAGASIEDRYPLTDEQIALVLPDYQSDPLAWALFLTLIDTGARLSEVVGLEVQDVDLQERFVKIRPNGIRGLKTKGSRRTLPLSQRVLEVLQEHRQGKKEGEGEAIFPKYARPRGNDAASAMLMKRFRKQITERKLTMHSLRHRMKDKLRNTGCPSTTQPPW